MKALEVHTNKEERDYSNYLLPFRCCNVYQMYMYSSQCKQRSSQKQKLYSLVMLRLNNVMNSTGCDKKVP